MAGAHLLLALVHVYWATGATWPAADDRSLSWAVLGMEASFAPRVVLPLAGLHLFAAMVVLVSDRSGLARLALMAVAAGVAARAVVGFVWVSGIGTDSGTAFYWLNVSLYTPACVILALADLRLLWSRRRARRSALALPMVMVLGLLVHSYQPEAVRGSDGCRNTVIPDWAGRVPPLLEDFVM